MNEGEQMAGFTSEDVFWACDQLDEPAKGALAIAHLESPEHAAGLVANASERSVGILQRLDAFAGDWALTRFGTEIARRCWVELSRKHPALNLVGNDRAAAPHWIRGHFAAQGVLIPAPPVAA